MENKSKEKQLFFFPYVVGFYFLCEKETKEDVIKPRAGVKSRTRNKGLEQRRTKALGDGRKMDRLSGGDI